MKGFCLWVSWRGQKDWKQVHFTLNAEVTSRSPSVHTRREFLHDGREEGLLSCRLVPFGALFSSRSISHCPSWLDSHSLPLLSHSVPVCLCVLTPKTTPPAHLSAHSVALFNVPGPFVSFHLPCVLLDSDKHGHIRHSWYLISKIAFILKNGWVFLHRPDSKTIARRRGRVGVNH